MSESSTMLVSRCPSCDGISSGCASFPPYEWIADQVRFGLKVETYDPQAASGGLTGLCPSLPSFRACHCPEYLTRLSLVIAKTTNPEDRKRLGVLLIEEAAAQAESARGPSQKVLQQEVLDLKGKLKASESEVAKLRHAASYLNQQHDVTSELLARKDKAIQVLEIVLAKKDKELEGFRCISSGGGA